MTTKQSEAGDIGAPPLSYDDGVVKHDIGEIAHDLLLRGSPNFGD